MSFPPPPSSSPPPRSVDEATSRLASIWEGAVGTPARRLASTTVVATALVAAHLARLGTLSWRLVAGAAIVVVVVLAAYALVRRRRRLRDARSVLGSVAMTADPERAKRTLRALALAERAEHDESAGSAELATLHLRRQLAGLSDTRVRIAAERRARRLTAARVLASGVLLAAFAFIPRWVEGFDVLAAHDDRAPLPLPYVMEPEVAIHPPDYLHERDIHRVGLVPVEVPYGSLATVHARPFWPFEGRRLVLTDGKTEVPFVDDGSGGVTARWPVAGSVTVEIAAKLGEIRIEQGDPLVLESIPDAPPVVALKGAPRSVKLLDEPEIPLVWEASDDHGLREVDLVLRAGAREERRVLSKLDAEQRRDSGGYALRAGDRFVRASFLPVEVTVEAKDNDPLTGPKWGKSAAITLVPPAIGEPEAVRYERLVAARDALVDLLAWELDNEPPKTGTKDFLANEAKQVESALDTVEGVVLGQDPVVRIPRRFATFARGQLARVRSRFSDEQRGASKKTHEALVKTTEDVVLALDRSLRTLSTRDAQSAARRLSRVATEAADGFQIAMSGSQAEADRGRGRADAAVAVIGPSGAAILRLGPLGADLGEIVANDLRRIDRAESGSDLFHAELAARDLAARLARPDPSFMGGGRGGSTESGGGKPEPGDEAESDAEQSFDAEGQAIEDLARDHAGNMEDVEQALHNAAQGDDASDLLEEARKHAKNVRDAVESLPQLGGDDDSALGAASRAAEQARQMAEALDRGDVKDAVEAGRAAERSLDAAKKLADKDPFAGRLGKALDDARSKLSPEVRWSEDAADKIKKRIQEHAQTGSAGEREKNLAERAKQIQDKGQGSQGTMPEQTSDLLREAEQKMRDAARALEKGDAEKALDAQKEAQRMLDQARTPQREEEGDKQQSGDEGGGDQTSPRSNEMGKGESNIPKAEDYKGPEAFRKRVLEGLAKGQTPKLAPAAKKYAEKLLR